MGESSSKNRNEFMGSGGRGSAAIAEVVDFGLLLGWVGGEGDEPFFGGVVFLAGGVGVEGGADLGALGDADGAGVLEEFIGGDGAVFEGFFEEVDGEVE